MNTKTGSDVCSLASTLSGGSGWPKKLALASFPADIWRTGIHEGGHICCARHQNLEVSGSTVVEGPSYSGLTWGPGSTRALRGKAAYDTDGSAAHDAVAVRVADRISRFVPGPGEDRTDGVFADVLARTIELMAGGAAEMILLGDAPPKFMASDILSANAIAGIVCRTQASIAAFVEHCYQEALVIIEMNKPVVLALARALIDHPERTLNSAEIDQVIMRALAAESSALERQRRVDWQRTTASAASFASLSYRVLDAEQGVPLGGGAISAWNKDSPAPFPSLSTQQFASNAQLSDIATR